MTQKYYATIVYIHELLMGTNSHFSQILVKPNWHINAGQYYKKIIVLLKKVSVSDELLYLRLTTPPE